MKFYCVVCNSKYKKYKECCTPESLIKYEKKGFFIKKENYYTLDGSPLTISEVLSIGNRELSNFQILQRKREEEKILQNFNLTVNRLSDLADNFPRSNDLSYLSDAYTAQELQTINLMEILNVFATRSDTLTFLKELYRLWQISIRIEHVSYYSKAWEYCDAAKVFIKKTEDVITPSLVTNLKVTNDIKTIVDNLSKLNGRLSFSDRDYFERIVEGVRIYMNTVLPAISDEQLNLIDELRANKFWVTGRDADEVSCDIDIDLFRPILYLASKQIKLRKDQLD